MHTQKIRVCMCITVPMPTSAADNLLPLLVQHRAAPLASMVALDVPRGNLYGASGGSVHFFGRLNTSSRIAKQLPWNHGPYACSHPAFAAPCGSPAHPWLLVEEKVALVPYYTYAACMHVLSVASSRNASCGREAPWCTRRFCMGGCTPYKCTCAT